MGFLFEVDIFTQYYKLEGNVLSVKIYMAIRLIHPARYDNRFDWAMLLNGVKTLAEFEGNLKQNCDKDIDYLTLSEQGPKIRTYLGDAWEVFVEMLIKSHPVDRRIGISEYKPCHPSFGHEDHGVDGFGVGTNLRPATVQCKFRSSPIAELTANGDHLVNFKNASHEEYGVRLIDTDNMLIVTNCKGLNYYTEEKMLNKKVRCLGREHIMLLVDNNLAFWEEFRNATKKIVLPI